jgi:uncharacterized Tic20 family protein
MNNQTILLTCIVLCSLGGWYVVISKYMALKAMLSAKTTPAPTSQIDVARAPAHPAAAPVYMPDPMQYESDYESDEHIPSMGPPPLGAMPYKVPPEVIAALQQRHQQSQMQAQNNKQETFNTETNPAPEVINYNKRDACNWASIMHISGLAFITGIPFLNIILPTVLWLLKKEQHPFLAKQGREVINFQITLTFITFAFLGLGTMFVWMFPSAAAYLLEWTRSIRIIFATSMYTPFNIFTVLPFFWGCIMVIRGTVAAYHGINYRYPYTQPFVFEGKALQIKKQTSEIIRRKEPQLHTPEAPPSFNKINFG